MTTSSPETLNSLLQQINSGQPDKALPVLEEMLQRLPQNPTLLLLKAEALRMLGRTAEAIDFYKQAGEGGAGVRAWEAAGILLTEERQTEAAIACFRRVLDGDPNNEGVIDALITTLFNHNRNKEGVELARHQLALSKNPVHLSRAALLLQSNDLYKEAAQAFERILALVPDEPRFLGSALVPSRFLCDWTVTEDIQARMMAYYQGGDFGAPQEYPLTHITWCADEATNLGVTGAYLKRMVPTRAPLLQKSTPRKSGRIRVGYLSCDFRNHATMHLMAGVFEAHQKDKFEVFAYDYSNDDGSDYRHRFLQAVEHHVPIHAMGDKQAAERIAADELDILFDLKLYTGGGRSGIAAYRPAPVQAAYIGFPGSAASPDIDYIVSDRFVTPDSSAPYYPEKFCRLPHSYQCNDRLRFSAPPPASRASHGLPEDKIVFGAFNQSYKIDRGSFAVWMQILEQVPQSVLWLLAQNEDVKTNLGREAEHAGIDPSRLIFAPFADPRLHLSRLQLADAVLDTLICNGHTTSSDALWAGVPVITAKGTHFSSRVSESLLNAVELSELVGEDRGDMVRVATRLGTDAEFRAGVRAKLAANRLTAPLFDTARFTRDFETAIEMMVRRHWDGQTPDHLDVPDAGPVKEEAGKAVPEGVPLQTSYVACPLCKGEGGTSLGFMACTQHRLWHSPLPTNLEWMRCPSCQHVYTRHYWTEAGLAEVNRTAGRQSGDAWASFEAERVRWTSVVERVVQQLGGYPGILAQAQRPVWLDVGCGDGTLMAAVADCGLRTVGMDIRPELAEKIRSLGLGVLYADFMKIAIEVQFDVISMMNVLEQIPYPGEALRKAAQTLRPGGILVLSMPDAGSTSWKVLDQRNANTYWLEMGNLHNFSRERMLQLLAECGFEVVDFAIPGRYSAEMEIYAIRA